MRVELISYTPKPIDVIARAASTYYAKWEDMAEDEERKIKLIKSCVKRGHDSVLEHVSFTFQVNGISRACSHQLVRHRIASYSQRSQRYVDEGEFGFVTPESITDSKELFDKYWQYLSVAKELYFELRQAGVKKEDARFVLPNACTTEITTTMNVRALRNFFKLRLAKDAQWEIRNMAEAMFEEVVTVLPECFGDINA